MADEDKKTEDKKGDADAGMQLDKVLAKMDEVCGKMDAVNSRMDAFEKKGEDDKKADAEDDKKEEKKADASKKDADDGKEKDGKEKADAADDEKKADAVTTVDLSGISTRLDQLARSIPKSMSDADYHKMADIQARADNVFIALGGRAPRPMDGESLGGYERRLVKDLKAHSARWKDVPVESFADDAAFSVMKEQVYNDAMSAARNPVGLADGTLRAITQPDVTGRQITTFVGQPRAWMSQFGGVPRRLTKINKGSERR